MKMKKKKKMEENQRGTKTEEWFRKEGSERRNLQSGVALGSKEVVALKAETLG